METPFTSRLNLTFQNARNNMSTPRTDGIEGEAYQYKWDCKVVHSEFARQLETELEAEREKVAKLKDIIRRASIQFLEDGPDSRRSTKRNQIIYRGKTPVAQG